MGTEQVMKPVFIACTDAEEAQQISDALGENLSVATIDTSHKLGRILNVAGLIILDYGFYEQYGHSFFINLFRNYHPPCLMLVPPDDIRTMSEIIKIGIRHIPKAPGYEKLLNLTVKAVLDQTHEHERLEKSVRTLKQRVLELGKTGSRPLTQEKAAPREAQASILNELVFVFKRGEIELPALPQLSMAFQKMVNKEANLQDIGELLKQDIAISSKIISVSNSVFYKGVTESKNLGQAISRLGLKNTKRYVDTICNRSLYFTKNKRFLKYMERLWEHSLACGFAFQVIEESLALKLENDSFTMGLLHDIGKLLLIKVFAELQLKKKLGEGIEDSELLDTIKAHHGKFGAALLKKWEYPESFTKIAAYHDSIETAGTITKDLLVAHLANLMAISMGFSMDDPDENLQAEINLGETESAQNLGLNAEMIDEFKNKVSGFMDELKGVLA